MLKITHIEISDKEYEYCLRCGRKLKNPTARLLGYGVICYNKLHTDKKRFKKLF